MPPATLGKATFRLWHYSLALIVWLSAATPFATAQQEEWLKTVFQRVQELRLNFSCFNKQARTLHILGVVKSPELVDEGVQASILSKLSGTLSRRTGMRVTKADTFQLIATDRTGYSESHSTAVQELMNRAHNADITILVRPLTRSANRLQTEIVLWTRDATVGSGVQCTPAFPVDIPIADTTCQKNFRTALDAGTVEALEAFKLFAANCPQLVEADAAIARLRGRIRERTCDTAFQQSIQANTVEALSEFLSRYSHCSQRATGEILLERARKAREGKRCADAYGRARLRHTADAYRQFGRQHGECPQVPDALGFADSLERSAPEPTFEPESPRPRLCYVHDVRPPDDWLSLRTHPSGSRGRRIAKLPRGTPMEMLGERSRDWVKVRAGGRIGWVSWRKRRWIRCQ